MRTFTRPIAVALFFTLALIPLVLFGHDGLTYDARTYDIVQRAPFPKKLAPDTFRRVSDWFADRIGLRNLLMNIGADLNVGLLRISINRNVVIGRDGWLFWTDDDSKPAAMMHDTRGMLHFQPAMISQIDQNLHDIRTAFELCGKTALVLVAPNKQSIYRDRLLPDNPDAATRLDQLMAGLGPDAQSVTLDTRVPLHTAKLTQKLPLYFKTDTHWNSLGAFYAYHALVARLAKAGAVYRPELASLDQYDVEVEPYEGGDIGVSKLLSPGRFSDVIVNLLPRPTLPTTMHTVLNEFHNVYLNPQGRGRVVLFGDSFSKSLVPYLARHFAEIHHYLYTAAIDELRLHGDIIAQLHADVAIEEIVERHLTQLLRPAAALGRVCAPGQG